MPGHDREEDKGEAHSLGQDEPPLERADPPSRLGRGRSAGLRHQPPEGYETTDGRTSDEPGDAYPRDGEESAHRQRGSEVRAEPVAEARVRVPVVPVKERPGDDREQGVDEDDVTNRRLRSSDINGAPAGPSAAALGCTNTTTTNNEPTQMTPVTMCTTRRMTMDASVASIAPPLRPSRVSYGSSSRATLRRTSADRRWATCVRNGVPIMMRPMR